jgi:hypothetical protein
MYFIIFSVGNQVPVIIIFALLISNVKKLKVFYKTTVFMTSILSTSVIGILWGFIYDPDIGPIAAFLGFFGLDPIYWLAEPIWAMLAILLTNDVAVGRLLYCIDSSSYPGYSEGNRRGGKHRWCDRPATRLVLNGSLNQANH